MRIYVVFLFIICCILFVNANATAMFLFSKDSIIAKNDSLKVFRTDTTHSPKKAAIFSALLPGLGQAYNKKYYKIPIIYVGLGALGYFGLTNHRNFVSFKNGYLTAIDSIKGNELFTDTIVYPTSRLFSEQEVYRNRRDIFILGFAIFYAANIIDAVVDAHLYHFDVSDNLSMRILPSISPIASIYSPNKLSLASTLTVQLKIKNKSIKNKFYNY